LQIHHGYLFLKKKCERTDVLDAKKVQERKNKEEKRANKLASQKVI
jgi:hypothetical protein